MITTTESVRYLPPWASFNEHQEEGRVPRIDVDADAMYEAMLQELASNPPKAEQFAGGTYTVRNPTSAEAEQVTTPPMTNDEARPMLDEPTQYWLEVAYQCMKMELQVAMRGYGFDIRIHDPEKKWAHKQFPPGRGLVAATWGREAREHFRRLRGVLPG